MINNGNFFTSPLYASRISNRCQVSSGHLGNNIFRKRFGTNQTGLSLYFLDVTITNLSPSVTNVIAAVKVHVSIQAIKLFQSGVGCCYTNYEWFYGYKKI